MRILLCSFFILITLFSSGQINHHGLPFIRNFSPEEYDASDQNWAAIQDHRGIMYFGNNESSVLEFDGKTWRKIPISGDARVLSLAADSLGTIYVGSVGEFGCLTPNPTGKLEYKSISSQIKDSLINISDVFKTYVHNEYVYFFSQNYLFRYDGSNVKIFDINPNRDYYNLFSFAANNRIYIGSYILGLREHIDTTTIIAPNGDFFAHKNIFSITSHDKHWVDIVTNDGIYCYHQETGEVVELSSMKKVYGKSKESETIPYHGISLPDNSLGLGFLFSKRFNFAHIDSTQKPIIVLNNSNGLQDESVLFQNQPQKGNSPIWLCLNNGISRADIHSQIKVFSEESGLRGGILSITEYNGTLFVGTMSGVFYRNQDEAGFTYFEQIAEIQSATWSFLTFNDSKTGKEVLLVGTSTGIFEIDMDFKITNVTDQKEFDGIQHVGYTLIQCKHQPDIVFIGWTALAGIKREQGNWENLGIIVPSEQRSNYKTGCFLNDNELWLSTEFHGITRVVFSKNDTIIKHYGVEDGIPNLSGNRVLSFDDKIYFSTEKGIQGFNYNTNRFEPAIVSGINNHINEYGTNRVVRFENGYAFSLFNDLGDRWVEVIKPSADTSVIIRKPFKILPSRWVEAMFTDSNGILWIAISNQLFSYDSSIPREFDLPYNALIRKVTTLRDSVLFHGAFYNKTDDGKSVVTLTQPPHQTHTLPYSLNSVTFEVASTFYEKEEETLFSYFLEGNDKEWSSWNADPRPAYMNLREGSYTFMVKAKNIYGEESSITYYSFSIKPPWYRTIVAYIVYLLLSVGLVWVIVVLNTRRLVAEKEHLEQIVKERTAEVVAQKEEIAHQNEEIKSSISYASRIQSALLTPKETIDQMFEDYFILYLPRDIVSGDFYWHAQVGNRKICVVADCTGHGVPGGFMSMLGIGYLTQIMTKGDHFTAAEILNQLRAMIIESLHQTGKQGESKDGMDLALYIIDSDKGVVEYAGANNPLVLIRENEIIQYKPDKMPIGIHVKCDEPFTNQVFEYKQGDVLYTFSDGYPDQFGGRDERKFMIKRLKELFLEIHQKPMEEQKEILHQTLIEWEENTERIDDIVIMGLRL